MSSSSKVKGWTYSHGGFPEALKLSDVELSDAPLRPSEILIRIKTVAVNPVDVQLMSYPLLPYMPTFLVPRDKGVGEDFAGVVEKAGDGSGFSAGDDVFGVVSPVPRGTFQEMIRIDLSKSNNLAFHKPRDWTLEQAAAIPLVWLTASTCISNVQAYMPEGGTVAVLGGSSSSGMYVVYQAKQRGWNVVATCSSQKADFVRSMGADQVIDYHATSVRDKLKEIGPSAIIDCVGGTECVDIAPRYVTVVGDKTSRSLMGGSMAYLFYPRMVLRFLRGLIGLGPSYSCINFAIDRSFLEGALQLPKEKIIIDSTFDFDKVEDAFMQLNTGRTMGKVVVNLQ